MMARQARASARRRPTIATVKSGQRPCSDVRECLHSPGSHPRRHREDQATIPSSSTSDPCREPVRLKTGSAPFRLHQSGRPARPVAEWRWGAGAAPGRDRPSAAVDSRDPRSPSPARVAHPPAPIGRWLARASKAPAVGF